MKEGCLAEVMSMMKMKYKEFPFRIDNKLRHKLDMLTKQLVIKDVWILVTGDEGSGKTNAAAYLLYYFHCLTGREFSVDHFYFNAEELFNYGKSTKEQLLNWDEAALGGLSTEWYTQAQINLLKLAITGRKLHHVFILCIPRFDKLKEDIRMDRIHAQIHMDCGKKGNRYGHYIYLTRRGIKWLNRKWKEKRIRAYGMAMRKNGGFGGDLPYVFDKVFTKEEQDKYESNKDNAIANIGKKKVDDSKQEVRILKGKIAKVKFPVKTKGEFAQKLGIPISTVDKWSIYNKNEGNMATPLISVSASAPIINNNGEDDQLDGAG